MRIQANIAAYNAQRKLGVNDNKRSGTLRKLSSGVRINSAADDAAGLAISEKMRALIRGSLQGSRNTQDGMGLTQTADAGMQSIHDMLQRQRELIVQGASDTNTDLDKAAIQEELDQITEEITTTAKSVKFNDIPLLCVPSYINGVPLADMIVNEICSPAVYADGRFNFHGANNNGDISQLLFGVAGPNTSLPAIKVGSVIYPVWNQPITQPTTHDAANNVWTTGFGVNTGGLDLTIVQSVSLVDNPGYNGGQSYKINYEVINNNPSSPVTFDFMYHVDTQLGANDRAPFEVGGNPITDNTSYPRDGNIPSTVQIYDNADNPLINGLIAINSSSGLDFSEGSEPDKLNLGQFNDVFSFGFGNLPDNPVGDSGYSVIWEGRTAGSQPVTMTTYYGVQNPPPGTLLDFFDSLWIQSGANTGDGMGVKQYDCCAQALFVDSLSVMSHESAKNSLGRVDYAINTLNVYRSNAGIEYNRLEFKMLNTDNLGENTTAAESRIRDADMAKEMAELVKTNILSESGTAMLAQANAGQQTVLQLLG